MLSLEPLARVDHDGRAIPELLVGWTWETDTRLRLHLRPNVFFHDGTTLNSAFAAERLRATVASRDNRALNPALDDVVSIGAEGTHDVLINLARPSAMLVEDLVVSLEKGDNIGTGPYHAGTPGPDQQLVLRRFDRYHKGKPTVAEIVVRPYDTLRTAWSSLLRGEVDVVSDVPADAVEFIRNDDVQVISFQRRYQFVIAFNMRQGALRSPAVRKALNLALDRRDLTERILQSTATPSSGPLWPDFWAYDESVPPYAHDVPQALALLDAAGYKLPRQEAGGRPPARLRFTCLLPENFSVYERLALEVQKSLLDIGVDMQLETVSVADFARRIPRGDFDAIFNDMISGPTPARPYIFWRSAGQFRGPFNVFGYENVDAERLFGVLRASRNDAAVRSATRRLQEVFLNDPPALFIAWNTRSRAIRRDFVVPENGGDPLNSLWEWKTAPTRQISDAR